MRRSSQVAIMQFSSLHRERPPTNKQHTTHHYRHTLPQRVLSQFVHVLGHVPALFSNSFETHPQLPLFQRFLQSHFLTSQIHPQYTTNGSVQWISNEKRWENNIYARPPRPLSKTMMDIVTCRKKVIFFYTLITRAAWGTQTRSWQTKSQLKESRWKPFIPKTPETK